MFYVYAYLRKDGTPYYIGKGKDHRLFSNNRSITRPREKERIVFIETNLTEIGALAIERRLIRWHGRKDQGTGILRNQTDGGDGTSNPNPKVRKKLSEIHKGIPKTQEHRSKISEANKGTKPWNGKLCSDETRRKMSLARKGKKRKPFSQEHKDKIRQARLREKLTCPVCHKTMNTGNYAKYNHGPKCLQKS